MVFFPPSLTSYKVVTLWTGGISLSCLVYVPKKEGMFRFLLHFCLCCFFLMFIVAGVDCVCECACVCLSRCLLIWTYPSLASVANHATCILSLHPPCLPNLDSRHACHAWTREALSLLPPTALGGVYSIMAGRQRPGNEWTHL